MNFSFTVTYTVQKSGCSCWTFHRFPQSVQTGTRTYRVSIVQLPSNYWFSNYLIIWCLEDWVTESVVKQRIINNHKNKTAYSVWRHWRRTFTWTHLKSNVKPQHTARRYEHNRACFMLYQGRCRWLSRRMQAMNAIKLQCWQTIECAWSVDGVWRIKQNPVAIHLPINVPYSVSTIQILRLTL
jgi:hypothetical protein